MPNSVSSSSPTSLSFQGLTEPAVTATPTTAGSLSGGINSLALAQGFDVPGSVATLLGVSSPVNQGDASVVLAQVEALLDETKSKGRAQSIETLHSGSGASAAASAATLIQAGVKLTGDMTTLGGLNAQSATLTDQEEVQQADADRLGQQVGQLTGQVGSLQAQLTAAQNAKNPDQNQIAALQSALSTAQGQLAGAQAAKSTADTALAATQAALSDLKTKITKTESDIATDQVAVADNTAQLVSALTAMVNVAQTGGRQLDTSQDKSDRVLKRGFEHISDTVNRADQDATRRAETAAADKDRLTRDDQDGKIKHLAEGLGASFAQMLATLQQLAASAGVGSADAGQAATARSRLTL